MGGGSIGRRSADDWLSGVVSETWEMNLPLPPTPHMRACLGCWRTMSEYSLYAQRHDQCTEMKSEKNRIHIGPVAPGRDRLVERQELLHCHEGGARRRQRRREDCGVWRGGGAVGG